MYLEVYPDVVFVLNFFIDFILLFLLKTISKKKSKIIRMAGAGAVGGLFAAILCIFPWINPVIRVVVMNIAASVLMLVIAFGRMKLSELVKQVISLYLITYVTGGLINSIYYYTNFRLNLTRFGSSLTFSNMKWYVVPVLILLLLPLTLLLLWWMRWYKAVTPKTYDVELIFKEQRVLTKGLMDTGNRLYDPVFKKPVVVVENVLLKELLTEEFLGVVDRAKHSIEGNGALDMNLETESKYLDRLRFIPYQSVGKSNGMMIGLMLDQVLIHTGRETICNEKVTAAICDNHLSTKDDYHVILHKELL